MSTPDVDVYDHAPEEYDAFQTQFFQHGSPAVAAAYQGMFGALELAPKQRVLEVGVGTGLNLAHYPADTEVIGIDRSEPMLSVARRRLGGLASKIELVCGDATQLPFEDESFDRVVCTFVLCSCVAPAALITEMLRVCRKGGRLGLFDFHRARNNQDLLADQFLLRETMLRGLIAQGRPVAVCDTLYDLSEHLPRAQAELLFDEHIEASFAQAFRATTIQRIS